MVDLPRAFLNRQEKLRSDFNTGDTNGHLNTKRDDSELNWLAMLSRRLPRRVRACKASVVEEMFGE